MSGQLMGPGLSANTYNPDNTRQSMVATDEVSHASLATCNWAAGADPTSGYDPDGNLVVTRTIAGTTGCSGGTTLRSLGLHYDARNLVDSQTQTVRSPQSGADVTRTETFSYNNDAQWASAAHGDGTPAGTRTTTYAYDPSGSGRLNSLTDWRGRASSTTYQPSGAPRTQSLGQPAGGAAVASEAVGYKPDGSIASLAWARSSDGASVRSHTGLSYDVGGLKAGEDVAVRQPDASVASTGGHASFGFDLLDRLTSSKSPYSPGTTAYSLDDGGNIVAQSGGDSTISSTYTNNRLATQTTDGVTETLGYDPLGQQTTRTRAGATPTVTAYDPAGHTASVDDRSASAGSKLDYLYDTTDRLIARTETPAVGAPTTTIYFYWGTGGSLAEEADGTGATKVAYLVDEAQEPLGQQSFVPAPGTPAWSWLLSDQVGNVATHLDDTGAVTEQAAFDPYGNKEPKGSDKKPTAPGASPEPSTLGFQGHITDPKSGSVILGARQYDPTTARFTTPDTFVAGALDIALGTDALTANRYLFAAANPVSFYDDGHWPSMPKFLKRLAKLALPTLALVPYVGVGIEAVSLATGHDWLDGGRKLSDTERLVRVGLLAAGALVGVAGGSFAARAAEKAAGEATKALKEAEAVVTVGEAELKAMRAAAETEIAFPAIKAGSAGGDTAGQAFPQSVRQGALDENPGTCVYCHMETDAPQVDHAIPRTQGGNATPDNAQTTCPWCNGSKGPRDFPVNPPSGYRGPWPPPWWDLGGGP